MGFFDIFKKRKKPKAKNSHRRRQHRSKATQNFEKVGSDIEAIHGQIQIINIALKKHDDQLIAHDKKMEKQAQGLEQLIQRIDAQPAPQQEIQNVCKQTDPVDSVVTFQPSVRETPQRLDVDDFTEQEKRIMEVFFQNKNDWLSYTRVGEHLGKSAHTIKNQMRQIRQRADLFNRRVGRQSRNLFKLKDDLRIEKYLHIGQPIERPVPIPCTDKSNQNEKAP